MVTISSLLPLEFKVLNLLKALLLRDFSAHKYPLFNLAVVVQVSGGKDSMVLLNLLSRLRFSKYLPRGCVLSVFAQHFNHETRGCSNRQEQDLVTDFCLQLGIPVSTYQLSNSGLFAHKQSGDNTQQRFRHWRQHEGRALKLGLEQQDFSKVVIATAHHLQDNVENLFFHLIRGCGIEGLRFMPLFDPRTDIFRPLTKVDPSEISSYRSSMNIPFLEDESNHNERYSRNFIRHQILPKVALLNPNYLHTFTNFERILEESFPKNEISKAGPQILSLKTDIVGSDIYKFAIAVLPEIMVSLTRSKIANLVLHIRKKRQSGGQDHSVTLVSLGNGWVASFSSSQLWFSRSNDGQ